MPGSATPSRPIDEIVIVAEPDLANLRNAKNLADTIKALRPTESEPLLVINKVGMPRRPEIAPTEFATSVECQLLGQIPFDAAALRHRRQQRPDDRRGRCQQPINDIYPRHRHARHRPQPRRSAPGKVIEPQAALVPQAKRA